MQSPHRKVPGPIQKPLRKKKRKRLPNVNQKSELSILLIPTIYKRRKKQGRKKKNIDYIVPADSASGLVCSSSVRTSGPPWESWVNLERAAAVPPPSANVWEKWGRKRSRRKSGDGVGRREELVICWERICHWRGDGTEHGAGMRGWRSGGGGGGGSGSF